MNILHISPYFPSINAKHAGGVCMGHEINELSKYHNVYILCFGSKSQNDSSLEDGLQANSICCIKLDIWNKVFNVITHPFTAALFATRKSRSFKKKIVEHIEKNEIQAVHIEYAAMGQYAKLIHKIKPSIKCTLVLHDVTIQSFRRQLEAETNVFKKAFLKLQLKKVFLNEKDYINNADSILTFSEKDVELINQIYNAPALSINAYFDVKESIIKGRTRNYNGVFKNTVCFYGQMSRAENHMAAMRLVDIVEECDDIKAYIVGDKPQRVLQNRESDSVIITGFLDDPDEILEKCCLAVFPLMVGAGVKIKVLHCLALGIPVITTNIGAEGIDETGSVIQIVETNNEFVDSINKYINDYEWMRAVGAKGVSLIEKNFLWEKTVEILKKVYP